MNKKQGTGRAAWAARALALVLLLAAWAPSARGEAEIRYVLQGMGMLAPVNNTHYLLAQSAGNKRWGVVDTDGAQLTDFAFEHLSYNAFTCFQDSLDEDPLMNWKALVCTQGGFVSEYRYGVIRPYSAEWAVGWVVSEGLEDAFDYTPDKKHFYNINRCDVFYLKDSPRLVASLSREQFRQAAAHGDYLSVEDRAGSVTVYDRDFQPTGLKVQTVSTPVYGVFNYALMNKVTTEIILDGCTEAKAYTTPRGTLFQVARVDFSGVKRVGICDMRGEWLLPLGDYGIQAVGADYAVITKDGLQGLYSYALGKPVVPCRYQSILTNKQGTDPYNFYGYVCGVNDSQRDFFRADTGEPVSSIAFDSKTMKAFGGTFYWPLKQTRYQFRAADGVEWTIQDRRILPSRGDGRLIVLRGITDGNYGIMTMHGDVALAFWYRNQPVITDDGKVILNTLNNGYCLAELIW